MGFRDKFKNIFGYDKKEYVEPQNNDENGRIVDESTHIESLEEDDKNLNEEEKIQFKDSPNAPVDEQIIDKPTLKGKIRSFKELDDLIHGGEKKIILDSDIILSDDDELKYGDGIKIDIDNLIIEGNGHIIDAKRKIRIFYVTGQNVTLKNCIFKNARNSDFGAVIVNDDNTSTIIEKCTFENNYAGAGGVILNLGNIDIKDSKFEGNCSSDAGGVINNQQNMVSILNCDFINNNSNNEGGAILNWGNIEIKHSNFDNNSSSDGGSINNQENGSLDLFDCNFDKSNGGAIVSYGKLIIKKANFCNNFNKKGGALINHENATAEIENSEFIENRSDFGGAIYSDGGLTIKNSKFIKNHADDTSGAISNQADLTVEDSKFIQNCAKDSTGALGNSGNCVLNDCLFEKNTAETMAAILSVNDLKINNCVFKNNSSKLIAGVFGFEQKATVIKSKFINNSSKRSSVALFKEGSYKFKWCEFRDNKSEVLGCITNLGDLVVENSNFNNNSSKQISCIMNNNKITLSDCKFINNSDDLSCISNNFAMEINRTTFENNDGADNLIENNENSKLTLFAAVFKDNSSKNSTIINKGSCNISESTFDNNESCKGDYANICNENTLDLYNPKFKSNCNGSVVNNGDISVQQLKAEDIERFIDNNGNLDDLGYVELDDENDGALTINLEEDPTTFTFLDNLIRKDKIIKLKNDITLNLQEIKFYEGGIEIDGEEIIIDGQGYAIDGLNKSRIFYITGNKITLKNIKFKNGNFKSDMDENSNGGGVIRVLKDSSLILDNCEFCNNDSDEDGGVLFNRGEITSNNCTFENNNSKYLGGAIHNKGIFDSRKDKYINNNSNLGAAIYNYGILKIQDHYFNNNSSVIGQPIFNNNLFKSDDEELEMVYNIGRITNEKLDCNHESFCYLNDLILTSNEIHLDRNIIFDSKKDEDFIKGIIIDKKEDLIIEGNGFEIDAKNSAALFDIQSENKVIIKNLKFKNLFSKEHSIIKNQADLVFRGCKFDDNRVNGECHLIENNNLLKIINTSFSNNITKIKELILNFKDLDIEDSHFINNETKENYILKNLGVINITGTNLLNNSSVSRGGLIYNQSHLNLSDSYFSVNSFISGDVIKNDLNLKVDNTRFFRNFSLLASIINNKLFSEISFSDFDENNTHMVGIISNDNNLKIWDSNFNKNNSSSGTLFNANECIIENSSFNENVASNSGGVIFNTGSNSKCNNCEFIGNSSNKFGGVIYNNTVRKNEKNKDVDLLISNCKFEGNSSDGGGSIANEHKGNLKIENSEFIKNNADYGGAIFNDNKGILNIESCIFRKNNANFGGAIGNLDDGVSLFVEDCVFIENKAEKNGGAIVSANELKVFKSIFNQNSAWGGGAIFSTKDLIVEECEFIENSSEINCGGAINNFGSMRLHYSYFKDNKSFSGGAVYSEGTVRSISNCEFIRNDFEDVKKSDVEFKDCIFTDDDR